MMPYTVFCKLGVVEARPTTITLQLADRSHIYPRGVIEDVLVKVDKFIFPADFIILDMEEDEEAPIILGRTFLATGQALIDVQKGELRLRVQEEEVTFNILKAATFPRASDNYFTIGTTDDAVDENMLRDTDAIEVVLTTGGANSGSSTELIECANWLDSHEPCYKKKYEELGNMPERPVPSTEQAPELELKTLPAHLQYQYLGENKSVTP